ncbi:MAG: hypothetical protein LBF43_03590 [Puniceicoccales bacterium]|nr:hypothetical protein [Puniceicoccales bacterium]
MCKNGIIYLLDNYNLLFIKIMGNPKDITHCFAFDKVQKSQKPPRVQRVRNGFVYGTYFLLGILIALQFCFLFLV